MSTPSEHTGPTAPRSVLVSEARYERGTCEIHVVEHITSQGETGFRAAAYDTDASTGELRIACDDAGVPYEVFGTAPATAAERLSELLESRYGRRLTSPDAADDAMR
jgi:hypothetical protein